jgi:hypothetical protein
MHLALAQFCMVLYGQQLVLHCSASLRGLCKQRAEVVYLGLWQALIE